MAAERWRRRTAMRSWNKRNVNGRSGELFSTALLLYERRYQFIRKKETPWTHTKTIWEKS
jgi:hypothetical protein